MNEPTWAAGRRMLVASGLGDESGGGLYVLHPEGLEVLDRLSTTGIAASTDGTTLARLLWTDDDPGTAGELLLYDARGVVGYRRVDLLQEPHGAVWCGDALVVVSTLANRILWLDPTGAVTRVWDAPGEGDSWHLNSVAVRDGRLIASAFGRFDGHRAWTRSAKRETSGIVFDVETGEDLLSELACPHDPLPFEDGWLVCNSARRELLQLSRKGRVLRQVALDGWTRGLAVDAEAIYVGVSAHRHVATSGRASVVALDRGTLRPVRSWELPCQEVFSLALLPATLVAGVQCGFGASPVRAREGIAIDHGTAPAMRPLEGADRAVFVSVAAAVSAADPSSWITLRYTLENRGASRLASAGENSVLAGARWFRDGVELPGVVGRARLPTPILPGGTAEGVLHVPTPAEAGSYALRVAVGQDGSGWFDDGDAARAWERLVEIRLRGG